MGYYFAVENGVRVVVDGQYPWPCPTQPNRSIVLSTTDILTRSDDGTYMKHTGMGCFGIVLKEDEITTVKRPVTLQVM